MIRFTPVECCFFCSSILPSHYNVKMYQPCVPGVKPPKAAGEMCFCKFARNTIPKLNAKLRICNKWLSLYKFTFACLKKNVTLLKKKKSQSSLCFDPGACFSSSDKRNSGTVWECDFQSFVDEQLARNWCTDADSLPSAPCLLTGLQWNQKKKRKKREQTLQSYLESPACLRSSLFPLTSASLFAGPHCPHALAAACKAKPPLISLTPFFNLSRLPLFCLLIICSLRIWGKKKCNRFLSGEAFHHGVL